MIGIAFQGCACRAAFHAGVAAALVEGGVRVALAAGTSSGSLVAAALAAGRGAALPGIFRSLGGRRLVSLRRLGWNRSPFDMSWIVRSTLRRHLGAADLRGAPAEALAVATRLRDLRPVVFSSRAEPDFVEPLMASCFFPVLYGRPVRLGGRWLLDGGASDNLPIEVLAERGAREVIAVVVSPEGRCMKDLRRRWWRPSLGARHAARLHVVTPRRPLELGSWDFHPDRIARAIDAGHAVGRELAGR